MDQNQADELFVDVMEAVTDRFVTAQQKFRPFRELLGKYVAGGADSMSSPELDAMVSAIDKIDPNGDFTDLRTIRRECLQLFDKRQRMREEATAANSVS